jgi:MYXO-CTERM domain-containing protein
VTSEGAASDDGCGCRVVGKTSGHELSWLVLAALGLVGVRRRRRG